MSAERPRYSEQWPAYGDVAPRSVAAPGIASTSKIAAEFAAAGFIGYVDRAVEAQCGLPDDDPDSVAALTDWLGRTFDSFSTKDAPPGFFELLDPSITFRTIRLEVFLTFEAIEDYRPSAVEVRRALERSAVREVRERFEAHKRLGFFGRRLLWLVKPRMEFVFDLPRELARGWLRFRAYIDTDAGVPLECAKGALAEAMHAQFPFPRREA